jgi:formate-dependent phosphoribosylglycinamide formyltransferase (GAR transformylase)
MKKEGNRRRKLLILASKLGYQKEEFSAAAKRLGVEVVFATDRCHQLEDPWKDAAIAVDFSMPISGAATVWSKMAKDPPGGILALDDRPTVTAAHAAALFGLPYHSPAAAEVCRSKLQQRQRMEAAGLPVPRFLWFERFDAAWEVVPRVTFPCVVKPVGLAGSTGVIRANTPEEFRAAAERVRRLLESRELLMGGVTDGDRLLVEDYIPGTEVAVEGLMTDSRLRILAIFDKPDPLTGPYFEETIYVTPSRLPPEEQEGVAALAACAARAAGLTDGPVHGEFRLNERGPWILEVAGRPIGGLCARTLRFGPEGTTFEDLLIRHALGLPGAEAEREEAASAVMMIPVPRSGVFAGVTGIEAAKQAAHVTDIVITARLHDYIEAWPEGSSYLGFIFARAKTPEEAEAAVREAHARMTFEFGAQLPVRHPLEGRLH